MTSINDKYLLIENRKQFNRLMQHVMEKQSPYRWMVGQFPLEFTPPFPCFIFFRSLPYKEIFFKDYKNFITTNQQDLEYVEHYKLITFNDLFNNYSNLLKKYEIS